MIRIMVDSASDCRNNEIYDKFISMSINIDGKEYLDGQTLDNEMFYSLLTESKEFPQTSQPSPGDFAEYFEQVKEAGDELIYFAISSGLSGTFQSANIAKDMVEYDGIYIIDTKTASHMIGLLAKHAKKLVVEGKSATEIVAGCEELKDRIRLYAGLDTLEYLKRGGRIGKASALVGTLANIKPVITVSNEGGVDAVGKALGVPRAIQMMVEKLKADEIDEDFPICSLYTYGQEHVEKLEKKLEGEGYSIFERLQIGSTIGTHVGPGVYGLFYVVKKEN